MPMAIVPLGPEVVRVVPLIAPVKVAVTGVPLERMSVSPFEHPISVPMVDIPEGAVPVMDSDETF
jgi:hypothetical protein